MALRSVDFVSDLVRWFDDTYYYLLAVGNVKEDVGWIITRVIRSIFEDYLAPARATPTRTSFGSDPHRRSTLVWGVIRYHLAEEKMLRKIKDHPIVVGAYAQWLLINSVRKKALEARILVGKVNDRVDELSATSSCTTKSISKLRTTFAASKKAVDQAASKVSALKK